MRLLLKIGGATAITLGIALIWKCVGWLTADPTVLPILLLCALLIPMGLASIIFGVTLGRSRSWQDAWDAFAKFIGMLGSG